MTENQQPADVPFAAIGPRERPTSVTVIAILAIVFGSCGVVMVLFSAVSLTIQHNAASVAGPGPNFTTTVTSSSTTSNGTTITTNVNTVSPFSAAYLRDPAFIAYSVVNDSCWLVLAVIAITAGIGLLSLKAAARVWIIRYAIADIIIGTLGLTFYILVIQPKIAAAVQSMVLQNSGPSPMPNMAPMMGVMMYVGDFFSATVLCWPVVVLYIMSRPHVKDAFGVPPRS